MKKREEERKRKREKRVKLRVHSPDGFKQTLSKAKDEMSHAARYKTSLDWTDSISQ